MVTWEELKAKARRREFIEQSVERGRLIKEEIVEPEPGELIPRSQFEKLRNLRVRLEEQAAAYQIADEEYKDVTDRVIDFVDPSGEAFKNAYKQNTLDSFLHNNMRMKGFDTPKNAATSMRDFSFRALVDGVRRVVERRFILEEGREISENVVSKLEEGATFEDKEALLKELRFRGIDTSTLE